MLGLYWFAGTAHSAPILLNRGDAPLSYALLNTGATVHQAAPIAQPAGAANIGQTANIQPIYQQDTSSQSDKLSLLLAEGNMMSHSADGVSYWESQGWMMKMCRNEVSGSGGSERCG